jgi:diguanylate cyclase (GGDEF)-like protein
MNGGDVLLDLELLDEIGIGVIVRDLDGVVRRGNGAAVSLVPEARPGSVLDSWPEGVVAAHRTIAAGDTAVVISVVAPRHPVGADGTVGAAPAATADPVAPAPVPVPPPPARLPGADAPAALLDAAEVRRVLRSHVEVARHHDHPLTVASLGIDGAATIEAVWGSEALGAVLRGVAEVLAGALRATDEAAVVGDDRFLVVLPGTRRGDAVSLVARLQEVCRRWVTTPDREGVAFGAGIVSFRPDDDADAVVRRAEAALERAMAAGRDRIEVA